MTNNTKAMVSDWLLTDPQQWQHFEDVVGDRSATIADRCQVGHKYSPGGVPVTVHSPTGRSLVIDSLATKNHSMSGQHLATGRKCFDHKENFRLMYLTVINKILFEFGLYAKMIFWSCLFNSVIYVLAQNWSQTSRRLDWLQNDRKVVARWSHSDRKTIAKSSQANAGET